jgi:hypothetical protein
MGGEGVPVVSIESKTKPACVWEIINKRNIRRRLLTGGRYINTTVNFQPIHTEPSDDVVRLIEKAVKAYGMNRFMSELNLSNSRFYSWRGRFSWVSINAVEKACEITGTDFLAFMEGVNVRSGGSDLYIPFTTKINTNRAILLAWLCMEGHLAMSSAQIDIPQDDVRLLGTISRLFRKEFGVGGNIYKIKGKNAWRLLIASAPLRYILCKYFDMPLGYKSSFIRVPKQIMSGSEDIKKAFISGCAETDCTIYGHKKPSGRSLPVFNIEVISEAFVKDFAELLASLGYKFSVFSNTRPKYENYLTWNLQIGSIDNFTKLYDDIRHHLLDRKIATRMKILISNYLKFA